MPRLEHVNQPSALRRLVAGITALATWSIGLNGCAAAMRRPPSAADSLAALTSLGLIVEDHFRYMSIRDPALALAAGMPVTRVPIVSQEQTRADAHFAQAALVALDAVEVEALPQDEYVTWLMVRRDMEYLAGWQAFYWTRLTDVMPTQSVLEATARLIQRHPLDSEADGARVMSLVQQVGPLVTTLQRDLIERADRGVRLPSLELPRVMAHVRSFIADASTSPFGVPADFSLKPDSSWQHQLAATVSEAIATRVNPSLESLAAYLAGSADTAPSRPGLVQYPGGDEHYAALLRFHSTIDVTPADAHAIGLSEVARIAALAVQARAEAALPVQRDSLRAMLQADPRFSLRESLLASNPTTLPREAMVVGSMPRPGTSITQDVARLYEEALAGLDSTFGGAAPGAVAIGLLTSGDAALAPLAEYEPPSVPSPIGRYELNPELLAGRSLLTLRALVLLDLMPGGHYQLAQQRRNDTHPAARRFASHAGYVNGWKAYALDVADSVLNGNDPASRFGTRLQELSLACGLVVDTGINAFAWSRDQAIQFLRSYLPWDDRDLERHFLVEAVERPGWLSAATLGARELRGMRAWAERELEGGFSLPAFHAELLRVGSVPLPVLGSHLERWIWEETVRRARPTSIGTPPPR